MMADKSQTLVEEKLALSLFLDALLREPETELQQEVELPVKTETSEQLDVPISENVSVTQQQSEAPPVEELHVEPVITETRDDIPAWAEEPFQILLFKVAGLSLAVPLQSLNGVVEWPESLTEMPGHADFYLGILQHLGQSVPVVDTAKLVFPQEKLKSLIGDDALARVKKIVLINDGQWGLACDEVAEVITLEPEQVRWRSQRTQRRWLLGTVIEHMCALLDTEAFAERLVSGKD